MWRSLACLPLLFAVAQQSVAELVVDVDASATVSGESVTLGDVSVIHCDCDADKVRSVSLGIAPRVGYVRQITRAEIQHYLQKNGFQAEFVGGNKTQVRRAGQRIAGSILMRHARDELKKWLDEKQVEVIDIRATSNVRDLHIPTGEYDIRYTVAPHKADVKIRVWMEIDVAGRHYQTYPVWFTVNAKTKAYVLECDVDKGSELKHAVRLAAVDVRNFASEYIAGEIDTIRVKHDLKSGHVLTIDDVEPIPAVQAGDVVNVVARSGAVTIATKGYAVDDGEVGEIVRLHSLNSAAEFTAQVTMRNTVFALGAE